LLCSFIILRYLCKEDKIKTQYLLNNEA
jgi:hypothetical protein